MKSLLYYLKLPEPYTNWNHINDSQYTYKFIRMTDHKWMEFKVYQPSGSYDSDYKFNLEDFSFYFRPKK